MTVRLLLQQLLQEPVKRETTGKLQALVLMQGIPVSFLKFVSSFCYVYPLCLKIRGQQKGHRNERVKGKEIPVSPGQE